MKMLLTVLFGSLLILTATPVFAAQGGASGQVRVSADVIDINYMKLTPTQDMRMPSVYTNFGEGETQGVSSEDATKVIGGASGQNALFGVTGRAGTYYKVTFNPQGQLFDSSGHTLLIGYEVASGPDMGSPAIGSDGNIKLLDTNGSDNLGFIGYIDFDGKQPAGSYNNYASPLTVTVAFEDF